MPTDHIRYDLLVQQALRGVVRDVLADTVKNGLIGDHHYFITFDTNAEGVRLSDRLHEQYPEEMTVVLQHQFWDLKVTDKGFEVGLSFGGVMERLSIPFAAIKGFADPSVQFGLQFEPVTEEDDEQTNDSAAGRADGPRAQPSKTQARGPQRTSRTSVPASPRPAAAKPSPPAVAPAAAPPPDEPPPGGAAGAEVVRLDRFRKK